MERTLDLPVGGSLKLTCCSSFAASLKMVIALRVLVICLLIAGAVGLVTVVWSPKRVTAIALTPHDELVVNKGRTLYGEHCASCHGGNLEGEANWRERDKEGYLPAPPHDASGHTWHHSDQQLFELTKRGVGAILQDANFKTRMPAYEGVLSDQEIIAVLSHIKSRWPKDIQTRHDAVNAARQRAE